MLPPVHLYRAGVPASDVLRIIAGNSRTPDKAIGDVHALSRASTSIGRRIEEMIEQYGADTLGRFVAGLARRHRAPDARRAAPHPRRHVPRDFTIEGDGFEAGRALPRARGGHRRRRRRSTSTSPAHRTQSGGAINASFSQTMSGVIYAVRCLVDPSIPMNEGCFRAVRMHAAAGTLVNPYPPAGVRWAHHQRDRGDRGDARGARTGASPTIGSRRARSSTCTRSRASAPTASRG